MRVCAISDIHGFLPSLPKADLYLLAGDYCRDHNDPFWYELIFKPWVNELSREGACVCYTPGNHDLQLERGNIPNMHAEYLHDRAITFRGYKIYGSGWNKRFFDWSFNLDEEDLVKKWAAIPDDTDLLLLHQPPFGYGDLTDRGEHVGSPSLTARLWEIQPSWVIVGHVHSGRGIYKLGKTTICNAAYVNEKYRPVHGPYTFDLPERFDV